MLIIIKRIDASKVTLDVDANIPVEQLKRELAEKTGVSAPQLRFVYKGNVLKDDETLRSQHVNAGDTIHLILNLVG